MRKTLTYDQGKEMSEHKKLSEKTGVAVFFADPHSPWQRGSNENTNGLLRQYLPKGTDLSGFTQNELNAIAWQMNNRPRKVHGFRTPFQVYNEMLQFGSNADAGKSLIKCCGWYLKPPCKTDGLTSKNELGHNQISSPKRTSINPDLGILW